MGLQRQELYRQNLVFYACGKPATFASPASCRQGRPHPVDSAVDGI
jgi:hypothetical protein